MHKNLITTLVNYVPSLVILIFSMVALYFSILLINDHNRVIEEQRFYSLEYAHTDAQVSLFEQNNLNAKKHQRNLYWTVIAVGLAGFIVVLLNSYKLRQIKTAEEEKKENLALLSSRLAAMEATFDGIGIVDKDGNLTYMNKSLMDLHGIEPDDKQNYIGESWTNLYSGKGKDQIKENVLPLLEKSGHWQGESQIIRTDGELIWAELSLTRLNDGGMIGTARDVSDKRVADKEKEELQSQFYQAQKMEAIGRLAGGIAHDFNNILAAMNGYAEFLIDDLNKGSEQHKFAESILQAGHQARSLVDQILTFSRRKDSASETIDLLAPLQESLSMLKASLPKTIDLKTDIDLEQASIEGNATQISQVIMNLCVNAKDAMDEERGKLTIGLKHIDVSDYKDFHIKDFEDKEEDKRALSRIEELGADRTRLTLSGLNADKPYVCLSVADTGSGMSKMIMEHIFEPFFTTKPVEKGTGLGLSTVHGVVIAHEGAMIVDSRISQGTTFELFFPVKDGGQMQSNMSQASLSSDLTGSILIVEDQENVRDMMENMLARLGHEASSCSNGMEALDFLRENPETIDLVITDQNMPKMTGLELIVQAHMDFPDLPFLLFSGYSKKEMQKLMRDHPAILSILKKPVDKDLLAQKIHAALLQKQSNKNAA